MYNPSPTGRIFDIQHFCLHDGQGIRTTLFFKGCPLRCLWCHNPEGIGSEIALSYDPLKCVGCLACSKVCPEVHGNNAQGHFLHRENCSLRGKCTEVCVTHALELIGRDVSVQTIIPELIKNRAFYENSGGGITLSGGEPVVQGEFLLDLATRLKKENLHVALETSGFCDFDILQSLFPYIDLFLFDYKETNPLLHKKFTGVSNTKILENLEKLVSMGGKIILRCPIIPGLNDRDDHFRGIANISKKYATLEGVEFLPYHNLGNGKAKRLGLKAEEEYAKPSREMVKSWKKKLYALQGDLNGTDE